MASSATPEKLPDAIAPLNEPSADIEAQDGIHSSAATTILDIEHAPVTDDPRLWARGKKYIVLGVIAFAAIAPALSANIYNPAFKQIQQQLHATSSDISLSLSLFIFVQGNAPLIWSAVSELKGRKPVYLVSMTIFAVGSIVSGRAQNMAVLIGMRILQAAGSSAALTVGAGTLADMYDPHDRGKIMGVYYAAPLLGPALGPIIGGILTSTLSWRATFYFLAIFAGIALLNFIFFLKDPWRRERSAAYVAAVERSRKLRTKTHSLESQSQVDQTEIKLSLRDVNIMGSAWVVLRRKSNFLTLLASGLLFALQYGICYTCARTFAAPPYNLGPIPVGLVLLSFGIGNVIGSVGGGWWSDKTLALWKARLESEGMGGVVTPEMRLKSTLPAMFVLPPSVLAYAWLCDRGVHVAGPVVVLFFAGVSCIWIYSSTLTYIVDANRGRSSTAVATNSSFRGLLGLVVAEVSAPIQDAIHDGGLYSIWTGLVIFLELLIVLVMIKGAKWRTEEDEAMERRKAKKLEKSRMHDQNKAEEHASASKA